jgi:hypothetical protein
VERGSVACGGSAKYQPHLSGLAGRMRSRVRGEPQDAREIRVCRVRVQSECGLGRCCKYQKGGARLVSLLVVFACRRCVVSGTHRSDSGAAMRLRAVGIPFLQGGEEVKRYRNPRSLFPLSFANRSDL